MLYCIDNPFLLVTRLCSLLDGVVSQGIAWYYIASKRSNWVKLVMKLRGSQYSIKWGSSSFTLSKLECSKQPLGALNRLAWDNRIGFLSIYWFIDLE